MGGVEGGVCQCVARFYFGGVSRGLVYIDPPFLFLYFCTTALKSIGPTINTAFVARFKFLTMLLRRESSYCLTLEMKALYSFEMWGKYLPVDTS